MAVTDPVPTPTALPLTAERVFVEYAPRVYSVARRMLGNDADAEDVTQDVLLKVVRKLDTFRGEADVGTWLHTMTVRAALAHRAKRSRREEHEIPDPLEKFSEAGYHKSSVQPWTVQPEQIALNQESRALVEKAIAELPESYRDVYVLSDVEELPNQDIANLLGISLSAVKNRLHRGRLLMRDALAPHFEEVGL